LWLLVWAWDFLWGNVGIHLISAIKWLWQGSALDRHLDANEWPTRLFGVVLSMVAVYIVGFFVGNLIGRTFWKLGERVLIKVPIIRAIYPAVKQVTDFVLADRSLQFESSRVVAVQPHEKGIWSIGLVTGQGLRGLSDATGQEMVTVFVPSSPTAFSGYVLVVPRSSVVEMPMTVEEAMRLLISGGVVAPGSVIQAGGKEAAIPPGPEPTNPASLPTNPQIGIALPHDSTAKRISA
jgi:uncharacterized membrane protein